MLSQRLVDGNHCFGRTNNVRGLQWRPDRNVSKTTWQREKGMNFKKPPFGSKRLKCRVNLQDALDNVNCNIKTGNHTTTPLPVTSPPFTQKEKRTVNYSEAGELGLGRWLVFTVACLLTQWVITVTLTEPKGNCWHRQQHIQLQFTPRRVVCNVVWRQVHPDHEKGMSDSWRKGEVRDRMWQRE